MRPEELPSDDDLLGRYAKQVDDDKWTLKGRGYGTERSREGMLALIKMNLLMDREPTDIATVELMYEIVRRLVALEG